MVIYKEKTGIRQTLNWSEEEKELRRKMIGFLILLMMMLLSSSVLAAEPTAKSNQIAIGTIWTLLAAFLVFFMQAGFALVNRVLHELKM